MSYEKNTDSTVQIFKFQPYEIEPENIEELTFSSDALTSGTEEVIAIHGSEQKTLTIDLFWFGGVIGITVILAYIIWTFSSEKKVISENEL